MKPEIRRAAEGLQRRAIEFRADGNDFSISARAIKYGAISQDLGGFVERIAPGCFTDSINNGDEVVCLVDHDTKLILGRTRNGSLSINDSPSEMRFRCKLNKNVQAHRDLYELVKDGTLSECSFSFSCDKQSWDESGAVPLRTVQHGKLYDVSVVALPAYSNGATLAEARARTAMQTGVLAESIKKLRRAAASMGAGALKPWVRTGEGDEGALVRGHIAQAHEFMEAAFAASDTARCIMDTWEDLPDDDDDRSKRQGEPGDPYDYARFRKAHREAHTALDACCSQMARARLLQPPPKK
jgi:uncharacterized protein